MRVVYLFVLLLLGGVAFAQSKDISVVSLEKINVVYEGVPNPLKIIVQGVDPSKISVNAPGLKKAEGDGNYVLTPSPAKEVIIYIVWTAADGTMKSNKKLLRIKKLPLPVGGLNGEGCSKCTFEMTAEQLLTSEVSVVLKDFLFVDTTVVTGFKLMMNNEEFEVTGNTIDDKAAEAIKRLPVGTRITIDDIRYHIPGVDGVYKKPLPIKIIISSSNE